MFSLKPFLKISLVIAGFIDEALLDVFGFC
jgi:hypothetical protein